MASKALIFATLLLVTLASAADPTCSTGVKAGSACCPAECVKCGGADCAARSKELKKQCCIGAIKNMNKNCLTSLPPCKITTKDPDFMAGSDIPDPKCEMGLKKSKACCPKECSVCGGAGCAKRGAYIKSECCPAKIKAGTRGCKDTGAPCALFRGSTGTDPEPMETMSAEPMETPMIEPEPIETPMEMEEPKLPKICGRMRTKFISGCFCYLYVSGAIKVKKAKLFRIYCRKTFGTKKKILSMAFNCRRFTTGPKAGEKVDGIIKKLNAIIPKCKSELPMIEKRM